ncbi:imidazolonepropionase [Salinirubellus salinus]|uniref:Imidazolonepropionase n=1 Tax=Salinirubellus salinus TaxID=1364945 RepID=A0A9E7R796_9EURY|nr:imidazolonepropionase [Salinirubellus salinus]UWM56484.1 imidazolonepropionase [Salinirubellus salinus]
MSPTLDAVVHDAAEVFVGPNDDGTGPETVEDGAVAIADGRVVAVGPTDAVTREHPPENAVAAVDASGGTVLPGFVDSHTHALFAGDRSDEFAAKLRGATYADILAEGGGILRTVRAVREASDEALLRGLLDRLDTVLATGTTTLEVKSGYGLDTETELRMLAVLAAADARHPVDVVPTFMGAHAVPESDETDAYVEAVVTEQLPAVAEQGVAEFCDVFCEEGVFSVAQSRRILEAGVEHGLVPKVHAEELTHQGGAALAAELGAVSADHLLHATREDARVLAETDVTAVLLPGTAFSLGAEYADPARFREAGATVAVASDFNPNCYAPSMPFAVTLACVGMGMAPDEAVLAATNGGASALDRADRGTLREGALGDCVVLAAPSHVHVPYRFGDTPVAAVLKEGVVVRD